MADHIQIGRILNLINRSGLGTMSRPLTGGAGGILMLHHVRPYVQRDFEPNRGLEIDPRFLDALIQHCIHAGYAFIPLADLPERISAGDAKRFLCLTFDDGYRDAVAHALPVLRKYQVPFTLFVTTGFADHAQPLWWLDMADLLAPDHVFTLEGQSFDLVQRGQREAAFDALIAWFAAGPSDQRTHALHALLRAHGLEPVNHAQSLCLDWKEIEALASEPLCTIGAHTLSHPLLATLEERAAREELARSRAILETACGRVVDQIAYPVGNRRAAGRREFELAREVGFRIGVTTRSGMIFPGHARHLLSLPRVSINGHHQSLGATSALLSGLPFVLANRGRRIVSS